MQAELSQLASRATEIETATTSLSQHRDALMSQSSVLEVRLAESRTKLDDLSRQRKVLRRSFDELSSERDRRLSLVSAASNQRVAVDNATISFLFKAAGVRAAVVAMGQEIYALRNPKEVAALARASAAEVKGSEGTDSLETPVDPDSIEGVMQDIFAAAIARPKSGLPRFRATDGEVVAAARPADDLRFETLSSAQPPNSVADSRDELTIQRDAAAASLNYTQAAFDRAVQQSEKWLADKLNVAASTLDLKRQMDDTIARIESLRDIYDNSSFALDDVRSAVADLDFQADLDAAATAAAAEASSAAEKEGQMLDARRQDLSMKLDNTQQQRVTRVVELQSSIREKVATRREIASKINSAQRQRLSLTQDVSALQQRVSLLDGSVTSISAIVDGLKQKRNTLGRQRDVLTAELKSVTLREVTAKQRMIPLAQRRDRLIVATQRQASARERLQALAARTSALVESARADALRRTNERSAVAASLSTLQLKLGTTEEEFSAVQAALQQAILEIDQLSVRHRGVASDLLRLAQRVQESRLALVHAGRRRDRAAINLASLDKKLARYPDIKARLHSSFQVASSSNTSQVANVSTSPAATQKVSSFQGGFSSQILQQIGALSSTMTSRRSTDPLQGSSPIVLPSTGSRVPAITDA